MLNKQLIKEIAKASADDVGLGIFHGFKLGKGHGTAEAHAEPRFIVLEPRFFELHDVESREHMLYHEIGHYWADDFIDYLLKNKNDEFQKIFSGDLDSPLVSRRVGNKVEWIYGQTRNVSEALADAFASYHSSKENKKFLQEKYPAAYKYLLPHLSMKFECPVAGIFKMNNAVDIVNIPLADLLPGEGGYYNMLKDLKEGTVKPQWAGMVEAMQKGELPDIMVYRLGNKYVVVDGNHRLAVATWLKKPYMRSWIIDDPYPSRMVNLLTGNNSKNAGDKPVVIFIHSLYTSALLNQILPLANSMRVAGFKVIVPELVGHGKLKGESGDEYRFRESMDAIADLIRKQKKKVVLVGLSIGGAIALSLGINLRSRVKAVFAISAPNGRHTTRREHIRRLSKIFGFDILDLDNDRFGQILQVMPIVNYKQQSRLPKIFLIHCKSDEVIPLKEFLANKDMFNVNDERTIVYESISGISDVDHFICAFHPRTLKFINRNIKALYGK